MDYIRIGRNPRIRFVRRCDNTCYIRTVTTMITSIGVICSGKIKLEDNSV